MSGWDLMSYMSQIPCCRLDFCGKNLEGRGAPTIVHLSPNIFCSQIFVLLFFHCIVFWTLEPICGCRVGDNDPITQAIPHIASDWGCFLMVAAVLDNEGRKAVANVVHGVWSKPCQLRRLCTVILFDQEVHVDCSNCGRAGPKIQVFS